MRIRPSASIRQNYNAVSMLCKQTGEPVYLTKNGEGDLVVMDMDAAEELQKCLVDGIRTLSEMPAGFPFFYDPYIPANRYHKMVVDGQYLILYQIRDDAVYVDYVIDSRQDYKWLVR